MTLEEAIRHCEKIVKENQRRADTLSYDQPLLDCIKCAEEHRQLADWLKELKRARYLLEVSYDLLRKQEESFYVLNILSETIFYDGAECDGYCLMEDIDNFLECGV